MISENDSRIYGERPAYHLSSLKVESYKFCITAGEVLF